jgi:hypothetical protein
MVDFAWIDDVFDRVPCSSVTELTSIVFVGTLKK